MKNIHVKSMVGVVSSIGIVAAIMVGYSNVVLGLAIAAISVFGLYKAAK